MFKGATRYPDYDPFGSDYARQSTDLPADVQDYLPGDPARNLKLKTSTDDFSGMGFGGFGSEMGPFGSGKVSRLTVSPLEMVGPPPVYRPPPAPDSRNVSSSARTSRQRKRRSGRNCSAASASSWVASWPNGTLTRN